MIDVKIFKGPNAPQGATVALMNDLHMPDPGWQLRPRLLTVKAGDFKGVVAIAYKDGEPVSTVLVRLMRDQKSAYDIAAYCKPEHRRKGITSRLIAAMHEAGLRLPVAREGLNGSKEFWSKSGVDCYSLWL